MALSAVLGVLLPGMQPGLPFPSKDFLSEWHRLEDTAAEECWLEVTFLLLLLKLGGADLPDDADDNDNDDDDNDNDDDRSAVDKPLEDCALPEDVPSPSPTPPEI